MKLLYLIFCTLFFSSPLIIFAENNNLQASFIDCMAYHGSKGAIVGSAAIVTNKIGTYIITRNIYQYAQFNGLIGNPVGLCLGYLGINGLLKIMIKKNEFLEKNCGYTAHAAYFGGLAGGAAGAFIIARTIGG